MKPWIVTTIAMAALLGARPVAAQEGFRLTSPVDVAIGRDYGFLANNQTLTDTTLVLRAPQVNYTDESARSAFNASYQPEFELFHNNPNLDAWNNVGNANYTFRITERLHFNATDDVLTTHDPTRSIPGILMFLPRTNFKENMAHVAVNYALTPRNLVTVSFDNVGASAPLNTPAFPNNGRVRNAGSVAVAHAFRPKQTVTATYSYLTDSAQFIGVSYEGDFKNDLNVHLSTGLLRDNGDNYLISGQVDKRLGASIWVSGGYHRFLSIFGTSVQGGLPIGNDLTLPAGVSTNDVYQVFSATLTGRLTNRAGIEIGAAATKENSGVADRDINNISGRLRLDYRLKDRLKIYTDFQLYSQTYNVFLGTSMDRTRYMAGILFDVSSHPNRVSNFPQQTKPTQR